MNRYETNSKGLAPAMSAVLEEYGKAPRSGFDWSSRKSLDVSPFAIIPFDVQPMLPNSDYTCSYDIQVINKNPTIKRMLSSMHLETRTYFVKSSDCWEGHNNFVTMGRSGNVVKRIPTIRFRLDADSKTTTCLPYNPYFTMSIGPARWFAKSKDGEPSRPWSFDANCGVQNVLDCEDTGLTAISSFKSEDETALAKVSALPFVMYAKIAKEYLNSNLMQDNPNWFPENENHDLILPYDLPDNKTAVTTASFDNPCIDYDPDTHKLQPTNDDKSFPWLNILYYCQRKGNVFNTGSPFPNLLRGDVPTLSVLGGNIHDGYLDFSESVFTTNSGSSSAFVGLVGTKGTPRFTGGSLSGTSISISAEGNSSILSALNRGKLSSAQFDAINFSMSQWRRLAVMTIFREKMARTDGSYNQMIQAQFGINPKWHEHGVQYLGGSYQPIVFSEVVQTSGDDSSPLGTTAGRFVSASQNKTVRYHSNDFGIVMSVLTLIPDDYYCQGVNRIWSQLDNSDIPFPIMNNLDPQATLNKELYVTGEDDYDEDVFNYAERYSEWKSARNEISGLLALPISKVGDIGAFFFNRLFVNKPQFNMSFVTGRMTDNENLTFSSTEQAQFVLSIARSKHMVYPLPAVSHPSNMGISYA